MKTALSLILNFGLFLFAVLPVFSYEAGLYSEGEYTVDETGSFNYSLPIDVPAGRGLIQPSLSVNYNSNGGDGLLGKGWSLGGLSSIHRCGAVTAKDGFIAPVNFSLRDRICLDGERLVPTEVFPGQVTFQMENFSHVRVIGYRFTSDWNVGQYNYFQLWDTNGVLSEYGNTADSKIEANLNEYGDNPVLAWALNKTQDKNNNSLEISYIEDNLTGEYYPDEIKYAKNIGLDFFAKIKFNYVNRSKNGPVSYTAGSKMRLTRQLSSIITQVQVNSSWTTHKQYSFTYDENFSYFIRLTGIQECAYKNEVPECLNPLTFTYDTPGSLITYQQKNWSNPFPYFSRSNNTTGTFVDIVDLNGDGLLDIYDAQNGKLYVGTGSGFSNSYQLWPTPSGYQTTRQIGTFGGYSEQGSNLIDFNGDGLPDYLDPENRKVWLNTGSSFETVESTSWRPGNEILVQFRAPGIQTAGLVDLNRDGLIDFYKKGGPLYLNSGSGFVVTTSFSPFAGDMDMFVKDGNKTYAGFIDINGDGYLDYYSANTWPLGWASCFTGWSWDDGNGWPRPAGSSDTLYISHLYSEANQKGKFDGLLDFNGDGLPDWYNSQNGKVFINNGNGFSEESYYSNVHNGISVPSEWVETVDNFDRTFAGWLDLNGDGFPDFYNAQSTTGQAYMAVPESHRLTGISNGNHSVLVEYSDLTDTQAYEPPYFPASITYPEKHVQSMAVVKKVSDDNGKGGRTGKTYRYYSAKSHKDHGFLGFWKIEQTDTETNVKKESFYRQDYPYIGRAQEEIISLNGITLEEAYYNWGNSVIDTYPPCPTDFFYDNPKVIWLVPGGSTVKKYELNNPTLPISITTSTQSWNANRYLQSVQEVSAGVTNLTSYTYWTDTYYIKGRVENETVTITDSSIDPATGLPFNPDPVIRAKRYTYSMTNGLLQKEEREASSADPSLALTTVHDYNGMGSETSTCASGAGMDTRCSFYGYSAATHFRFPDWSGAGVSTNDLKTEISYQYDNLTGKVLVQTDEKNNLQTSFEYDAFGRVTRTDYPDDNFTTTAYSSSVGLYPPTTSFLWKTVDTSSTNPDVTSYYDMMGRVVRTVTKLPLKVPTDYIIQDVEYDERSRVYRKSRPYLPGQTVYWFTYTYDALDRPLTVTNPLNQTTSTQYGFDGTLTWVQVTDAKDNSSWTYKNSLGQVAKTKDALNSELTFTYWPDGSQKTATDPDGNVITYYYDGLGRKISQDDPTTGTWTYKYNSASELVEQQDNKGNITNMSYDILGRLTCSITSEGSALFYYDEIDGRSAYGKLLRTVGPGAFHQAYTEDLYYDSQLRLIQKKVKIGDDEEQIFSYSHDTQSRLDTVTYPSGFAVKYEYADGILKKVYRANDPTLVYWQAQELNADGTVINEVRGNGVTVTQQTDLLGRLYIANRNTNLWKLYVYDEVGNVMARYNSYAGFGEVFTYDELNRLNGSGYNVSSIDNVYVYDPTRGGKLGNLTSKPDLGELYYGGTSGSDIIPPHAINYVTTATGTHYFDYDANGNVTAYFDRTLYWNAENRLSFIRDQENASAFFYSPTGAMLKKTSFAYQSGSFEGGAAIKREKVSETLYVDGLYEINKENGNTARKHLIKAGGNSVAVYTETTGTNPATNLRYFYYDNLGSLDNITDENGTIIHIANFDAWGRERHPQNMNYDNIPTTDITDLGYTGHRQVGNFGLVHMRGRVYDPLLGRFLSPDPIIQNPLDLQTYNRYAYVRNNPLTYIDPSGYGFLKSFKKFFKKVVAPVLGMVLTGGGMHFITAGFLSGGVGAAVNGGNILKGAVTGAFSAAAFNWAGHVNHGIRPIQAHFIAGAVSSGFSASIYGGSMGRAALTGGISGALGKSVTLNNRFKHVSPGNFHAGQFAATMAAGGIGSYISGGSFGDGAAVAGIGYVYNFLNGSKEGSKEYEELEESRMRQIAALKKRLTISENPLEKSYIEKSLKVLDPSFSSLTIILHGENQDFSAYAEQKTLGQIFYHEFFKPLFRGGGTYPSAMVTDYSKAKGEIQINPIARGNVIGLDGNVQHEINHWITGIKGHNRMSAFTECAEQWGEFYHGTIR